MDVVRLVAGDPLSVDSVITEVNGVARSHLHFEIVPGLPASDAVPTYAGLPLGSSHTVADVRGDCRLGGAGRRAGSADTAGHGVSSGRGGPDADRIRALRHDPCVVTSQEPPVRNVIGVVPGRADRPNRSWTPTAPAAPVVVTIGKTVANRAKLNWWESAPCTAGPCWCRGPRTRPAR